MIRYLPLPPHPYPQTEIKGLNVAFLDGRFSPETFSSDPTDQGSCCSSFTEVDVVLLKQQLRQLAGDVDILLTCEWPQGVLHGLQQAQLEAVGELTLCGVIVGCGSSELFWGLEWCL